MAEFEDNSPDEVKEEARKMGWRDDFQGDPEKYITAADYVERGKHILPIVKDHNKKLEAQVADLNQKLAEAIELQRGSQEAIATLKKNHEADVAREREKVKKELIAEIKEARREGNLDREEELRDQLSSLPEAPKPEDDKAKPSAAATPPAPDPRFLAWQAKNPWYGTDLRRTALANAIGVELRRDPAYAKVEWEAFYDLVKDEVEKVLSPQSSQDRVAGGGRPSGAATDSRPGKRSYRDLPADAKAQCDEDAKALVGKGRAFATVDEWRASFVEQYFRGE